MGNDAMKRFSHESGPDSVAGTRISETSTK